VIIFGKKCFRIKIPSKQDAFDEEVEEIKESNDYSVRFDEEPTKRWKEVSEEPNKYFTNILKREYVVTIIPNTWRG